MNANQAETNRLNTLNSELSNKLAHFENKNGELQTQLDELTTKLTESQTNNCDLEGKVTELNAHLNQAQHTNSELTNQLNGLTASFREAQEANANLTSQLNKIQANSHELNAQLNEALSKLNETHNKTIELSNQLNESHHRNNEITGQLREIEHQSATYKSKVSHDYQSLENIVTNLSSELSELKNLKQNQALKIEAGEKAMHKMQAQNDSLSATLREYEGLKQLELATLRNDYNNKEIVIQTQLQDLLLRTKNQEKVIQDRKADVDSLQREISELRSLLIQSENEFEGIKASFQQQLNERVCQKEQEAIEFKIKYEEEREQNGKLKEAYERKLKSLSQNDLSLNETMAQLNRDMNERDHEINVLKHKLTDYESEINAIVSANQNKSEVISEWIEKYNQQEIQISETDTKCKALCEEIESLNDRLAAMSDEKCETNRYVEELTSKIESLVQEKTELKHDLDQNGKEIMEIRGMHFIWSLLKPELRLKFFALNILSKCNLN